MLKSKALDIIGSFSSEEVKEFREFLSSSYYNTNKTLSKFYDLIAKFYPDFNKSTLTKEYLYGKLYPGEKYRDEVIRNLLSRLLSQGESYLRVKGFEEDSFGRDIYLIEELNKRKIGSLFDKNVNRMEKLLAKKDIDGNSYFYKFRLETEKFNYNLTNRRISSPLEIDEDMEILKKRGEHIINFFIMTHLKETDFLNKFSNLYNYDIDDFLTIDFNKKTDLINVLVHLMKRKDEYSSVYEIYYYLISAFQDMNETSYYFKFKEALLKNGDLFSIDEKHYLFGKLIDYAIIKNRASKDNSFAEEHFNNYVLYLEKEYYKHSKSDYLPLDLFRNVLIQSLRRRDFEWTEEFIKKFIVKLKKDYQDNMYNYSVAFLEYQKGNFEKALEAINKVVYNFFTFKYDVRNLNLMICYELEQWESVRSILESYKRFLLNNKMVGRDRKEFYGNFLKYVGKVTKLKSGPGKTAKVDKDFLRKEVISTNNFSYKDWVLEKIDQL